MAGTSSPESPRDGLRKRGRQPSFDLLDLGDSSPVATTSAGVSKLAVLAEHFPPLRSSLG